MTTNPACPDLYGDVLSPGRSDRVVVAVDECLGATKGSTAGPESGIDDRCNETGMEPAPWTAAPCCRLLGVFGHGGGLRHGDRNRCHPRGPPTQGICSAIASSPVTSTRDVATLMPPGARVPSALSNGEVHHGEIANVPEPVVAVLNENARRLPRRSRYAIAGQVS